MLLLLMGLSERQQSAHNSRTATRNIDISDESLGVAVRNFQRRLQTVLDADEAHTEHDFKRMSISQEY
jgi:hypothetical protein